MGSSAGAFAQVRAGQIHEATGDAAAARETYRAAWSRLQYADEGNEWAEQARTGLERLGG